MTGRLVIALVNSTGLRLNSWVGVINGLNLGFEHRVEVAPVQLVVTVHLRAMTATIETQLAYSCVLKWRQQAIEVALGAMLQ